MGRRAAASISLAGLTPSIVVGNTFAKLVFKAFVAARRGSRSSYPNAARSRFDHGKRSGSANFERRSRAHRRTQSEPAPPSVHTRRRRMQKDACDKLL